MYALMPNEAHPKGPNPASPRCPACGSDYPRGSRFCAADGTRLNVPALAVPCVEVRDSDSDGLPLAATLAASTPPAAVEAVGLVPAAPAVPSERWLVAGRYLKLRTLGDGAQAAVWLVQDIQSGRVLALKQFRRYVDPGRCRQEIEAAARIEDHTHILKIHELHRDPDTGAPFVTMEYLEGETLEARLAREELSIDQALSVLHQVSRGLCEMHDKLLVHRDVKPANIMLLPAADLVRVKLMDLGITKSLTPGGKPLTLPGGVVGTLDYAAPEQLRGELVTPAFDIYALGVVAHRLLTGRLPCEPAPRDGAEQPLPEPLRELLASMLHDDPRRRPQRMRDVTRAIEQAQASAYAGAASPRGRAAAVQQKHAGWSPRPVPRLALRPPAPKLDDPGMAAALVLPRRSALPRLLGAALTVAVVIFCLFAPMFQDPDPLPASEQSVNASLAVADPLPGHAATEAPVVFKK